MSKQAVIYARFSPRRNHEDCLSCETQLEYCRSFAEIHQLEVIGEYRDEAISGKEENREGLNQALDAVTKAGGVLIVYKLDRLARNTGLMLRISKQLEKAGANLASLHESIDTTSASGRLFFTIMAAFAEFEREQIAERTSEAMQRHQKNGRRMSKRIRYGWEEDPESPLADKPGKDGKHYHLGIRKNAEEQNTIQRIMELHEAGLGSRRIIHKLNDEGRDFRGNPKWYPSMVDTIIKREKKETEEKRKGA